MNNLVYEIFVIIVDYNYIRSHEFHKCIINCYMFNLKVHFFFNIKNKYMVYTNIYVLYIFSIRLMVMHRQTIKKIIKLLCLNIIINLST